MTERTDQNVNPAVYGWFGGALIGIAGLSLVVLGGPPTGPAILLFLAGAWLVGLWMWKGL